MLAVLVAFAAFLVFEIVVWRYGADSRDANDWAMPKPTRESPRV